MGPRRWTTTLWLSAILCWALAAWLFLPRAHERTAPPLRVLLVDASATAMRSRAWLAWVRAELCDLASGASSAGQELAVASFADGLATGFAPGDPARFLEKLDGRDGAPLDPGAGLGRGATRLAAALEGVEPWLLDPARPAGELFVLGPLTFTGRSPAPALARLAAHGVAIAPRPPPPLEGSDLGLVALTLAPRVERGAPLVALARLVVRRGTAPSGTALLVLEVECDGAREERSLELALPETDGEFELPLDCGPAGPGEIELRARVALSTGPDLLPENDGARARSMATDARLICVLAAPETRAIAEEWLAPGGRSRLAGLQFALLEPSGLAERLAHLDALVTFDLGPRALPAPLLEPFVRCGGGWLALAGWSFLEEWIPGASESLFDLLPSAPVQGESAPRDVVLLVDGSGSMEGAPFESVRAAALELVSAALPSDRVSLRFFTRSLEPAHLLKERSPERGAEEDAARMAARELLRVRVPSGTTSLFRSLRELRSQLAENETLLLLLTDGWDRENAADERQAAAAIAAELRAAGVRLVVIGVGQPNVELLAALAGGEGEVRSGRSLESLQAIFRRELHGPRLVEGDLELRPAACASGSLADEVTSAASTPSAVPARLERFVRNRLRSGGEALWQSADGEPVLSLARAGLGRTAFFASNPGPGWGSRHVRAAQDFDGLLRWLARGPEREVWPRARLESGVLCVTGLAPRAPAELHAELLDRDGARVLAACGLLPPVELGADVLRTRTADLGGEEWSETGLLVRLAAGAEPELVLPVERTLSDEFAWRERSVPTGWLRAEPTPRPATGGHGPGSHTLALLAAGVGLGLLFAAGVSTARGSRSSGLRSIHGRDAKEWPSPENPP